ncbi:exonuclease domain-containing protein [Mesorhizobium marinum]|uniref:exonuclease domain-containing protein n=1 Tax=Mesorhizobium marinum TaxID=3228790 RepID=UPI0034666066
MTARPDRLAFIDVETTGLYSSDRIVSLGLISVDGDALRRGPFDVDALHLVFDPGKKSHKRAEEVHGWHDWTLRHQNPFERHAQDIKPLLDGAVVVAHNLPFDMRFVEHEFERLGASISPADRFCTMERWRSTIGGRCGLDAVLAEMGRRRSGSAHGALEDAWLALHVYLRLNDLPLPAPGALDLFPPTNLQPVPPLPDGPLPRRSKKKKAAQQVAASKLIAADRDRLARAVRPTGVMMLWVARADDVTDEAEIAAVVSLVRFEAARMRLVRDDDAEQDIAAELFEIEPTPDLIAAAARALLVDDDARARLPAWLRLVASADGHASLSELESVRQISAAFRTAVLMV